MILSTWPQNVALNGRDVYSKIANCFTVSENSMDADMAFIWSVLWHGRMAPNKQVWDHYRSQNKPVLVAEVGGLVRGQTWRLSINGIGNNATFPLVENIDPDRPSKLGLFLRPWNKSGDKILICGQHDKSMMWDNMPPMIDYYKQLVSHLRSKTNRPIVIRNHPRCPVHSEYLGENVTWQTPQKQQGSYDSYDMDFNEYHCVISHSSNMGIQAILHGVPAIVSSDSLAHDVGSVDIENLNYPDREKWLISLSHKEWTLDELQNIAMGIDIL